VSPPTGGRVANKPKDGISQKKKRQTKKACLLTVKCPVLFEEWLPATIATPFEKMQEIMKYSQHKTCLSLCQEKRGRPEKL
jgi:hypothetical protein